jgi:hypothetical protein
MCICSLLQLLFTMMMLFLFFAFRDLSVSVVYSFTLLKLQHITGCNLMVYKKKVVSTLVDALCGDKCAV